MATRLIRVHGRVQGVFYRNWTVAEARALGLAGWVRNRDDGTVEILACGTASAIDALIERCRDGPPAAQVTRIDSAESDEAAPTEFSTRPTV